MLPAVGLDEGHDHVRAALLPPVALAEHGVGLADPGRRAEVDAQLAAARRGLLARIARLAHSLPCQRAAYLSARIGLCGRIVHLPEHKPGRRAGCPARRDPGGTGAWCRGWHAVHGWYR